MSSSFVLRKVNVLDEGGGFEGPLDVRVGDGVVAEIGAGLPTAAVSYELDGLFLMPGVFDCHAHVGLSTVDPLECLRTPITRWSLQAGWNLSMRCGWYGAVGNICNPRSLKALARWRLFSDSLPRRSRNSAARRLTDRWWRRRT